MLLPQVYRAAELGYIDINRVSVAGHSYGGYCATALVSSHEGLAATYRLEVRVAASALRRTAGGGRRRSNRP